MGAPVTGGEQLGSILLRGQSCVLEMVAAGSALPQVLEKLCAVVEEACVGALCAIHLVSDDGAHLRHGAAPSLPPDYCRLIDGIAIGPTMGSCGSSAYARETVIVTDIATDPLWRGYAAMAATFGLASCASTPILAGPDARLLGTFAIYHRTAGPFAPLELQVLRPISDLAAIAILSHLREEARQASETRRARTAAASHVIETALGEDGRWLGAPLALCALLGRTEEEILALRLEDVAQPGDLEADRRTLLRLLRGDLDTFETEWRLLRKDGTPVWTALAFSSGGRAGDAERQLAVDLTDVTERRRVEEALRASQKMESLALLAPGLAHDFNNLLTAILCNASLAQAQISRESAAGQALATIDTIGRRAADLTRQLAYAGSARAARKPIDLNPLAREIAHTLSASLAGNIRIELDLGSVPPILGDPSQIHQVAMNLVINAAQAIGDAGGAIRLHTAVEDLRDEELRERFPEQRLVPGEYVLFEVSDTGGGIAPEVLLKIFDPFFTTKPAGRGVGLAVSRSILREHRAGIEVRSDVGRGSAFRVHLPVARGRAVRASTRPGEAYWPRTHGTVLLFDRDPVIRSAIVRMLRDHGFEAIEASDGQDALLQLAKRRSEVSLVLFDVTSTSAESREALAILRERWPDLKVILTVDGEEPEMDALEEEVRVLAKPYSLLDLKRAMSGETDVATRGLAPGETTSA
jgi:PAS domain S-box-containing protein